MRRVPSQAFANHDEAGSHRDASRRESFIERLNAMGSQLGKDINTKFGSPHNRGTLLGGLSSDWQP